MNPEEEEEKRKIVISILTCNAKTGVTLKGINGKYNLPNTG